MLHKNHPSLHFESLEDRHMLAATAGLQFVGLSSTTAGKGDANVAQVANAIANSQAKDVEVSALPFEFAASTNTAFTNLTKLVQKALPGIPHSLEITLDLDWFPHTPGNKDQTAFWAAWDAWSSKGNTQTAAQKKLTGAYMDRVAQVNTWIRSMQQWATANKLQNKLKFTIVPMLEDTDTSPKAYDHVLQAIKEKLSGISNVSYRRSCLSGPGYSNVVFRVSGASLELHGKWSDVSKLLQSGDTWSNDGTAAGTSSYTLDQFLKDEQAARSRAVDVLFWDVGFNGANATAYNESSRVVSISTSLAATMKRVL